MTRFLPFLLAIAPLPALADSIDPSLAVAEPFVVCEEPRSGTQAAPGTEEGSIETDGAPPSGTWLTTELPLVREVTFGVRARTISETFEPVTITWTHPPFASGVETESWQSRLHPANDVYDAYRLERESELVPGDWTITATHAGRTLYSVTFTVGAQDADPAIAEACASVSRSE